MTTPLLTRSATSPYMLGDHQRLLERGKTKREARRRVKRMLARHFFRQLQALPELAKAA